MLGLACASSQRPQCATEPSEPTWPPSLPETEVKTANAVLEPPPLSPDYPCEESKPAAHEPGEPKKSNPRDGAQPGDKKQGRLPPEVIQKVARDSYGKFRACYEEGLRKNPKLNGKITARFVIDTSGEVRSVRPVCTSMPDPGVVRCVIEGYRTITFPPPEGGIVTVVYPVMFSPGD